MSAKSRLSCRLFVALLIVGSAVRVSAQEARVPYQFIAKMYSEALGRAADAGGWQNYVDYFRANGCTQTTLAFVAGGFFDSDEYMSKGYSPSEAVLTLFRAVLSREPDAGGFSRWEIMIRDGGWAPGDVARGMAGTSEFASLVPGACAGGSYRQDWAMSQAIDIGDGVWTQADLQNCIDAGPICSIPPRKVVYLRSPFAIPSGKTLETQGGPDRRLYARQARIVRTSGVGNMVTLAAGAKLRDVWVSGQRHLFKDVPQIDGVLANVEHLGGAGGEVAGCRVEFALQGSNIETQGGGPIAINDNLVVGYTGSHTADGTQTWASDGISNHNANATVSYNDIVDPTGVGIVVFGHDGIVQASDVFSNFLLHAGLSAYGSLALDTLHNCQGCQFTGSVHGNQILAGTTQHVDIMLAVGAGPWAPAPPSCGPNSWSQCGVGGAMEANSTIWGDENQRIAVQVAVEVEGMKDARTSGNTLYVRPQDLGACYRGAGVVNDLMDAHAGGDLMLEADAPLHACIGH